MTTNARNTWCSAQRKLTAQQLCTSEKFSAFQSTRWHNVTFTASHFLKQAYMSLISRISHIILFIYFFTFTAFSKNVLEVVTRCASNFTVFQFHNKTSLSCRLQKTFSSPLNSDSKTLLNLTNEYWVVNVGYCAVQNSAYYFRLFHWINYWTLTVIASS